MRLFRWAILLGELVLLALALAVPRIDLPQTAFNEADTPVNQATSVVVLGCRSALTGLRAAANAPSAAPRIRRAHPAIAADLEPQQPLRSRSLLALLCALLC
ncbi:MAG TPA: hypothetical protein VJP04_16560 [Terriglobales bacterium]|nr:hypothetical protein [Terriglobales bacterium]